MSSYFGHIISPYNENEIIESVYLTNDDSKIEIEFQSNTWNYKNIENIVGLFNTIGKVTLLNCQFKRVEGGAGGQVKRYSAEYLLTGINLKRPLELFCDSVKITTSGLINWTKLYSVNYAPVKILEIELPKSLVIYDSNSFSITLFPLVNTSHKREDNSYSISERIGFEIKPTQNKINLWDYLKNIDSLKKLLFILSAKKISFEDIIFYQKNDFFELFRKEKVSLNGSPSNIISLEFDDIKEYLNKIIDAWFNTTEIHTSIDLILEKSVNTKLSRENYFLNCCFSLETFHRRFKNYNLFDPKYLKTLKNSFLKSVEDEEMKKALQGSFAHVNNPNFKQRLFDFKEDFSKILPKGSDIESYISKIVKTRNFLVHRSSNKNTLKGLDILYAAIYLENIVKANIYRVLGIEEDLIDKKIIHKSDILKGFYDLNKSLEFN